MSNEVWRVGREVEEWRTEKGRLCGDSLTRSPARLAPSRSRPCRKYLPSEGAAIVVGGVGGAGRVAATVLFGMVEKAMMICG